MKHFSVFLLFALAGLALAARKRVQTKSAGNTKGATYCKMTETPSDEQFGFNFVTKVESCVKCNTIMFFNRGGLYTDFITGSRNEADSKVCECFQTNLGEAPLLMFKSRQLPKDSCDAEFCLSQYATLLRIQQEKMGVKVSARAMLNSPNHWEKECDEVAMDQTPFPTVGELFSRIPEEAKEQGMRNLGRFAVMKTQTEAQVEAAEKATVPVMVTLVESEDVVDGDNSDSIDLEPADMIGGFIYADQLTKPLRKIVQVVTLGPGAGICSANSPHYANDKTSQCKEVVTAEDCAEVAGMYGAYPSEFKVLEEPQANLPSACFVRSSSNTQRVYWNTATTEHQGTKKKKGSSGFEHTLLCACYKDVEPALIQLKPSADDGL